jgi:beta-lactam-binding protein with PASTA domain
VTEPPSDSWPTPDGETVVIQHPTDETLVGAPPGPPPPAALPPPEGVPPDRRIGAGMLLGLGAILLVLAGIAIAWFLTHRDSSPDTTTVIRTAPAPAATKVAVPRLVGMKEPAALVRLAQAGLRPREVYRPTKQAKGVVVSQKPQEAKEVAKGSQVTLLIDSGAPKVAVPDVAGKSLSDAQAALDEAGLDSTVTQVTSTQPAGTVVDQAPKSGSQLAKGSTVTLSVAKEQQPGQTTSTPSATTTATTTQQTTTAAAPPQPQNATMPDVSNQQEAAAVQAMGSAGVLASLVFVPSEEPLGTVVQQAKPSGTTVPFHSHVQINLSSGPGNKPKVPVPSVIGKTLDQAVAAMNADHLRLIYLKYPVTSQSQAGKIVQQSPLGGSAPQNAQVLVYLGVLQKQ